MIALGNLVVLRVQIPAAGNRLFVKCSWLTVSCALLPSQAHMVEPKWVGRPFNSPQGVAGTNLKDPYYPYSSKENQDQHRRVPRVPKEGERDGSSLQRSGLVLLLVR